MQKIPKYVLTIWSILRPLGLNRIQVSSGIQKRFVPLRVLLDQPPYYTYIQHCSAGLNGLTKQAAVHVTADMTRWWG